MENRKVYSWQFFLVAFINIITFKVVMLPSYLVEEASNSAMYSMLIMMIIELLMLIVIFAINTNGSIIDLKINESIKTILLFLILISATIKFFVYEMEGIDFVQQKVFEGVSKLYILLPLVIVVGYLAYKGFNNISRVCEISIWLIIVVLLFSLLFSKLDIKVEYLKAPLNMSTMSAIDKYFMWFSDFTPLLMCGITKPKGKKFLKILTLLIIAACPILLMLAFVGVYGSAGEKITYAFSKLAIYNQLTTKIGAIDIPIIIAFLVCMIIKLSLILNAIIEVCNYFIKKRGYITLVVQFINVLITLIVVKDMLHAKEIATSILRYLVLVVEYSTPLVIYATLCFSNAHKKSINSQLNRVKNEE